MPIFAVPENLAFDNYDKLITGINDWLDRSDLSGSVPGMIALAESMMNRELAPLLTEKAIGITSDATGLVTLPDDFGTLSIVRYTTNTLDQITAAAALDVPANYPRPRAYSMEIGALRLWPNMTATVTLLYQPKLPNLSQALPNNFLLSAHPDMYFFGAMLFAEGYLANDNRAALFKNLFNEALASVKAYLIRQRFGGRLIPRATVYP